MINKVNKVVYSISLLGYLHFEVSCEDNRILCGSVEGLQVHHIIYEEGTALGTTWC
jgi:hypothetical protein